MQAVEYYERELAKLQREHKIGIGNEGWIGATTNWLGDTRNEANNGYLNANYEIMKLRYAAQGKLLDGHGKLVSLADLIQESGEKIISSATSANEIYSLRQESLKNFVEYAPVVLASVIATAATAGTAAPITVALINGVTTFIAESVVNNADLVSSDLGNTAANRQKADKKALRDGAVAFIGSYASGQIASGIRYIINKDGKLVDLLAETLGEDGVGNALGYSLEDNIDFRNAVPLAFEKRVEGVAQGVIYNFLKNRSIA